MQKNLFSLASLTHRLIRNKNILWGGECALPDDHSL
jgi:hypothetical protein